MSFESIPEVIASYPERFKPEEAKGTDAVVQLDITGEGGGTYQLVIQDGNLDILEGEQEVPTLTATVAAEDWLRVNNGEVSPMTLLMQGKLKFSGSLPMALKFRSMFETYA
ncbi:sterol-binding protein [Longibacter salinarum]|uniref:Sterol-binding protein n=1 Tax=Longibacter salinarum TaxID=1850348 RepID=A0A2A8D2M5_9BACT|nr:SCP2 sterol-binding domain-containing protein [Longibacter salinarum]PEN15186.1 sterol-binding protein [Longibacter salinarum]